jgi:hypothetical protein
MAQTGTGKKEKKETPEDRRENCPLLLSDVYRNWNQSTNLSKTPQ